MRKQKTPRELIADIYIASSIVKRTQERIIDNLSGTPYCNHDDLVEKHKKYEDIVLQARHELTDREI